MKSVRFVLPDVALPKLKKVIITYYRAHHDGKTVLNVPELVAYSQAKYPDRADWIYSREATGSNSFLCKLGILEEPVKYNFRLTDLGLELGQSLRDNTASKASACWSKAIECCPFLIECFDYVGSVGDIDQLELQKEIVVKAGNRATTSTAALRGARTIIDIWEQAQYIKKQGASNQSKIIEVVTKESQEPYIRIDRIAALRNMKPKKFNLLKLIEVCDEINFNYKKNNFFAVGILVRVILDHVPPIFGEYKKFNQVVANYAGTTRSFHESAENLDLLTRKISDMYLHDLISHKNLSTNSTQVAFQATIDVLLNEIISILSSETK